MTQLLHRLKSPSPLAIVVIFNLIICVIGFWLVAWSLAQDYTDLALYYCLAFTIAVGLGNVVVHILLSRKPKATALITPIPPTPIPTP